MMGHNNASAALDIDARSLVEEILLCAMEDRPKVRRKKCLKSAARR
jgi:hypothetical protein